jgi:hypothetical protein
MSASVMLIQKDQNKRKQDDTNLSLRGPNSFLNTCFIHLQNVPNFYSSGYSTLVAPSNEADIMEAVPWKTRRPGRRPSGDRVKKRGHAASECAHGRRRREGRREAAAAAASEIGTGKVSGGSEPAVGRSRCDVCCGVISGVRLQSDGSW